MPSAWPPSRASDRAARSRDESACPPSCASCSRDLLHVVEELQEHDPGEHRQAVEVAVEPLVLAHDVAADFDDGRKPLGGGQGLRRLRFACLFSQLNSLTEESRSQISDFR